MTTAVANPTTEQAAQSAAGNTLHERTVALVLTITRFGISKKARMDNVQVDADKKMLRMSKKILDSDTFTKLTSTATATRQYLRETALPSATFKSSVFLVPIEMVQMVNEELTKRQGEFYALVETFLKEYQGDPLNNVPGLPQQVSDDLRSQYNAMDYPPVEKVKNAFSFGWSYISFDVPGRLAHISKALFEQESAKAAAKLTAASDDVRLVLREGMAKLVESMVEKLSPTTDGKKRVLRPESFDKIGQFLNMFNLKNVTDDEELAVMVQKAKEAMSGIDVEQLRSDDDIRTRTLKAFEALAGEVKPLVVDIRARAIDLSEDAA